MEDNGITMEACGACLLSQPWLICYCKSHFGTREVSGHISVTQMHTHMHTRMHTHTLGKLWNFIVRSSFTLIHHHYILLTCIFHPIYSRISFLYVAIVYICINLFMILKIKTVFEVLSLLLLIVLLTTSYRKYEKQWNENNEKWNKF